MKKLSAIQKCIFLILIVAFLGAYICSHVNKVSAGSNAVESKQEIAFSKNTGFYNEAITVELTSAPDTEIYYTLDGSCPVPGMPQTYKYEKGIYIEADETEYTCTIRAAAFEEGSRVSDVESRIYLMGVNVNTRYSTPVLAVTGSWEDFYNYEDGIMVHGKMDEEYIATHPEWAEAIANDRHNVYGNFYQKGRDAEKEVYMTLFDEKGNIILSQNCGFRVYGASSRMKNQPSFRLYARSEYDEINDFDYTFFEDQYTPEGTLQSEYKRVIVRNSGDDNGYAFIRSELATRIAKQAGYTDAPSASPVCVYLNGSYYGVHWFITNFDDTYFQETYGEYPGEMYIFEGTINEVEISEEEEDPVYAELAEEYNETMAFLESADLSDEENWQKLNAFIDVEGFIKYTALQHYNANTDSLSNNFRVYRYYAPDGEYTPNTVFDGKYRFLLFDLDETLGYDNMWSLNEPETYTLTTDRIDGDHDYEKLFANILKRDDCRQLYIKYTLSFMNYYYSESYVSEAVDEMHAERAAEFSYQIHNTDILLNNHSAPDITEDEYMLHQIFLIKRFAQLRPEYVTQDLMMAFGEMTPYTLQISNPNQANITVDYASMTQTEYTGQYFAEVPVQITAAPQRGYRFAHWLVNGEIVEDSSIMIEESRIAGEAVTITCVCEPDETADLCISGVKSKDGDFIEITNLSTESKDLGKYCLTDNSTDRKSTLPAKVLGAGETVTVYCKGYSEIEALGQPVTNFNLKAGETVSLYDTDGKLLDSVEVPQQGSGKGVWRMDRYTGIFREVIPE